MCFNWSMMCSMNWSIPIYWNMSSNWNQRVQHHELRATDCYFLGGFVRSNLSKPCAFPSITYLCNDLYFWFSNIKGAILTEKRHSLFWFKLIRPRIQMTMKELELSNSKVPHKKSLESMTNLSLGWMPIGCLSLIWKAGRFIVCTIPNTYTGQSCQELTR